MESNKRCKRLGCNQFYEDADNHPTACRHHLGPVIFHDTKKGYSCCQQIVYDWDEFSKLLGCQWGPHSDQKQETNFFKSDTVANAERSLGRPEVVVKSIDDLDREIEERERKLAEESKNKPEEPVLNKDGLNLCANFGCNKPFRPEENVEGSCNYHTQHAGFHDVKKFWPCCKKEAWDWDDFMKLPTCAIGVHKPKMRVKK